MVRGSGEGWRRLVGRIWFRLDALRLILRDHHGNSIGRLNRPGGGSKGAANAVGAEGYDERATSALFDARARGAARVAREVPARRGRDRRAGRSGVEVRS